MKTFLEEKHEIISACLLLPFSSIHSRVLAPDYTTLEVLHCNYPHRGAADASQQARQEPLTSLALHLHRRHGSCTPRRGLDANLGQLADLRHRVVVILCQINQSFCNCQVSNC